MLTKSASRMAAEKNKNSACIEKAGVVSYESQGRLGLRRVVRVPRSAERKTGAVPRMEELFRSS